MRRAAYWGLQELASCSWRRENGGAARCESRSFSFGLNEKWVSACSLDCRVVTAPQMMLRGAHPEDLGGARGPYVWEPAGKWRSGFSRRAVAEA